MIQTDVPWDRIVHFFGRATDVPTWMEDLAKPEHKRAEDLLLRNLEHQDGVIQATPVAVALIVEVLREGRVQDRGAVVKMLRHILEAARFQIEVHGRPPVTPSLASVIAPSTWWPAFEGDETDDALWEEWSPSEEEFAG